MVAAVLKPGPIYHAQVAALPVRGTKFAGYDILLIRSRETRRWIIPKGWPMKGRSDHQAAAQEAFEEAGVTGKIHKHPIGAYTYQKRIDGAVKLCRVMVYRLDVERELKKWQEQAERERQWFEVEEAARLVDKPRLAGMIRSIAPERLISAE